MITLASLIPVMLALGRSNTKKAAKLAVYEATMIMAKPAHTIPSTRALKLRGVPSPMPELSSTPHVNQSERDKFSASSSVFSVLDSLKRPNGLNRSSRYNTSATTCTDNNTITHKPSLNGCRNDTKFDSAPFCKFNFSRFLLLFFFF